MQRRRQLAWQFTCPAYLFTVGLFAVARATEHWGYHGKVEGEFPPSSWANEYPACGRHHQSPINFDSLKVIDDPSLQRIIFVDYDEFPPGRTWNFQNNGHTVAISANYTCPPQLQGGSLRAKYQFTQLHFHWGEKMKGSEHHIDGRLYPLEMHIVHSRRNEAADALMQDEIGMAVIGVFFEYANTPNEHLKPITDALSQIAATNETKYIRLPGFTLKSLLPHNADYFRYNGSLTTPPCNQIVQWSVMRAPVTVSKSQLDAFRSLQRFPDDHHPNDIPKYIDKNNRPVQEVGDRKVLRYRSSGYTPFDSGTTNQLSPVTVFLLMTVTFVATFF
ncbi:putative carbonic anhydrase 3 [Paramacrobiotus metropolitanus]|uniref:putative carbonic anhydrase 3 n=1 Tax=Paramacrobiotus metropolitanus TaxID=2943436 RepID=UPI0024461711|nr:putative carbonic anhydrase 3 [Paramacrobiotus metropolitanus]